MPAFKMTLRAAVVALAAIGSTVGPTSTVTRAQDGHLGVWNHEQINGIDRFWTETQTGSSFTVWCKRRSDGDYAAVIDVDIEGRSAPAFESIQVGFDGEALTLRADENGNVQMNCAYCKDQMIWIWAKMRTSRMLQINFGSGGITGFGLTTTTAVMDAPVCKGL